MSNADRLRSGLGIPMSVRLVDIGPVEQHAPSTSSDMSPAHPCQWIRSDTTRYTQQGAASRVSNSFHPTALAPPTLKSKHVHASVLRTYTFRHCLQKTPSPETAHHTAPLRASGRSRPPTTSSKPMPQSAWSCVANTRTPLRIRI
jgi:hypothetical protein